MYTTTPEIFNKITSVPRVSKLEGLQFTSFLSQPPHSALLTRRTMRVDLPNTKKKLQAAQEALSNKEDGEACDIGGSCEGVGEVITNGELNNRSLPASQSLRLCKSYSLQVSYSRYPKIRTLQ